MNQNSTNYLQKKQFFKQVVTLFGRKPAKEALVDPKLTIYRLHLAESNKPQGIISEIIDLAAQRDVDIHYHSKQALSRISKNGKQDQGVCIDILCPKHQDYRDFLSSMHTPTRLIALDGITNPQNLGMIIRSICAGKIDGLLLPEKGCAPCDALVVKASAGTLFRCPILHCEDLPSTLKHCQQAGAKVYGLSSHAKHTLASKLIEPFIIYVLGNETHGLGKETKALCDQHLMIPMNNGVESLNVAVTASLLAFKEILGSN